MTGSGVLSMGRVATTLMATVLLLVIGLVGDVRGEDSTSWKLAESRVEAGAPFALYIEQDAVPGRPGFKVETSFGVTPSVAAAILMETMLSDDAVPDNQRREVLERSDNGALVYTFVDLPFMLSDREMALRIEHTADSTSGVHRIDWHESNDELPEASGKAVRLAGTNGYWLFEPNPDQSTRATYLTRAEVGGSIPDLVANRLMRAQALDSVEQLRGHLEARSQPGVAAAPPGDR